jgi:hypothetical protein
VVRLADEDFVANLVVIPLDVFMLFLGWIGSLNIKLSSRVS